MEAGASTRRACCYTNDAKVVAAFGIAPNSPRLQRGANLSQLSSQVVPPRGIAPRSLAYRARALLLSYGGVEGMVARRGNAPRSAGCEPVVLLLNYRAMKVAPAEVAEGNRGLGGWASGNAPGFPG